MSSMILVAVISCVIGILAGTRGERARIRELLRSQYKVGVVVLEGHHLTFTTRAPKYLSGEQS